MSGLYLVWRCADVKRRTPVVTDSPQARGAFWRRGACSDCGEPVWFQRDHIDDRRLVCWPCANAVGVAA